jgi:hypothetical protein
LVSIGAALAEDSSSNESENPAVIAPQSGSVNGSDAYSVGITSAEESRPPNIVQQTITSEPRYAAIGDSLDAYSIGAASVQDPASPITKAQPIIPQHVAASGYVDADSLGNRTIYADGTVAPFGGIYESGIRFRVTGDASWYRFLTSDNPRALGTGNYLEGDFLVGYAFWLSQFNITGLVGPAFAQIDNLGVITERWGVTASIDINVRPTDWMNASASVKYASVSNNLQVQAKAGLKVLDGVYVGPEAKFQWQQILPVQLDFFTHSFITATAVSPETNISYMHLGAFTAVNVGPVVVGFSGGWAHDHQLGSGYYGSASLYVPF